MRKFLMVIAFAAIIAPACCALTGCVNGPLIRVNKKTSAPTNESRTADEAPRDAD